MRYLIVIFCIYLCGLSAIPCTDGDSHEHHAKTESGTSSDPHDHEDTCPPFCSCNCCGVTVAFLTFEVFTINKPIIANPTIPVFDQTAVSLFNHSIWQPPKI
jgi:hypothetical protein